MREELKKKYSQKPQLSSSHHIVSRFLLYCAFAELKRGVGYGFAVHYLGSEASREPAGLYGVAKPHARRGQIYSLYLVYVNAMYYCTKFRSGFVDVYALFPTNIHF